MALLGHEAPTPNVHLMARCRPSRLATTVRDHEWVTVSEMPGWTAAAIPAAVRLAAEAGTEVDEALEHLRPGGAPAAAVADLVVRLEQSADLTEVATDLAALLWAECEDVPRIAAILDEPVAQAALEAVAEARRVAAGRLADSAASRLAAVSVAASSAVRAPTVTAGEATVPPSREVRPEVVAPARPSIPSPSPVGHLTAPRPLASVGGLGLRSAAGAVAAGTVAAALVAVGRRVRRA